MKKYQIFNFQDQLILGHVYNNLDEAKRYIDVLQETYDEAFYVVEINVVYSKDKK